jgi:hypothetical protein
MNHVKATPRVLSKTTRQFVFSLSFFVVVWKIYLWHRRQGRSRLPPRTDSTNSTKSVLVSSGSKTEVTAATGSTKYSRVLSSDLFPVTTIEKAPEWMVDNHKIISGYRRNMGLLGCASSAGGAHNETFNIWSHAFAAMYFLNAFMQSHRGRARWQALGAAYLFSVSQTAPDPFFGQHKFFCFLFFVFAKLSTIIFFFCNEENSQLFINYGFVMFTDSW